MHRQRSVPRHSIHSLNYDVTHNLILYSSLIFLRPCSLHANCGANGAKSPPLHKTTLVCNISNSSGWRQTEFEPYVSCSGAYRGLTLAAPECVSSSGETIQQRQLNAGCHVESLHRAHDNRPSCKRAQRSSPSRLHPPPSFLKWA